jgi:hypothetical protein
MLGLLEMGHFIGMEFVYPATERLRCYLTTINQL